MTNAELIAVLKKNPISVGCGIVVLALAVGIYFRSGEIPAAEEDLNQKAAESERHAANIRYSDQLNEQLDAITAANKEIETRLVRASALGPNTQFFYRLESETGVKLIDFRPGGLTPAPKGQKTAFNPVQFSVSANGTMSQLMDFLFRLEGGPHYCRVLNARLSTLATNRNAPMTLQLDLELLGLP